MQFAILHSEKELKETYEKYGWQSAIVSLYLAYLSLRERDKISRRVEDYTDKVSDRDLQVEEKSFRAVTDLYIHALKNDSDKNRWSWLEIKSYQQLIQIVIVPFDLNINSLPTKSEEEDLFS